MSVAVDRRETDVLRMLHALLAESLKLWGTSYNLAPLEASCGIVIADETKTHLVVVEPHLPSDLFRWSVTVKDKNSGSRQRSCSSILGVLNAVRAAVAPPQASATRLGIPVGAP